MPLTSPRLGTADRRLRSAVQCTVSNAGTALMVAVVERRRSDDDDDDGGEDDDDDGRLGLPSKRRATDRGKHYRSLPHTASLLDAALRYESASVDSRVNCAPVTVPGMSQRHATNRSGAASPPRPGLLASRPFPCRLGRQLHDGLPQGRHEEVFAQHPDGEMQGAHGGTPGLAPQFAIIMPSPRVAERRRQPIFSSPANR